LEALGLGQYSLSVLGRDFWDMNEGRDSGWDRNEDMVFEGLELLGIEREGLDRMIHE
jgi:hypothetical protein